jgi:hypothetical protein
MAEVNNTATELERITAWLTTPATDADRAQFEADCAERRAIGGAREQDVRELLSALAEGCALWRFRSPPRTWKGKVGRAGWAAVRDRSAVAHFVTAMT